MLRKILIIVVIAMFYVTAVLADQAAWITQAQADKVAAFLKDKKRIRHYCAPCDDKGDKIEDISTIDAAVVDESKSYWEVKVNGKGIDLAYVYFETKDGKWKNLAKELDVKVKDVPKYLPQEGN